MKPDEAIRWAGGSQKALADWCGVTESAVSQWVDRGLIPMGRAYQLESLSRGELRVDPAIYRRDSEAA
jgi:DNA-binding transcriptional regulator YdaS (Cro superfamily)